MNTLPATQRAVQLTGPDKLTLNNNKEVFKPGPHQILAQVEVTGLCFSDLKLLKQFSAHVRKSDVIEVLPPEVLSEIPSYVPDNTPTVPGHETVVRIIEVGEKVSNVKPGDRRLVQADFRWLKTAQSNAAFGYNFEGALQEYVLLDERAITAPDGESMLIPAADDLSASAVALVEPWACVEDSYVVRERQRPLSGGRAYTVDSNVTKAEDIQALADESLDDVVFLGANADLLELVFPKVAKHGLVNIVQRGETFGRPVVTPVGRIHYGGVRITGTTGSDIQEGYAAIPENGEIRPNDQINIVGAAGPMGTMHVIRNLCQGMPGVTVYGGDMSDERLEQLAKLSAPLAAANHVAFHTYNAKTNPPTQSFNYIALMVPVPALVEAAVQQAAPKAIINIFAGIPATVSHPIDLDTLIARNAYFIGTSGSTIEDMKIVLSKVTARTLDTNLSVAAISGLDGAVEGIRAVETQAIPGKILVYPSCKGLPLTRLTELKQSLPEVAAKLKDGTWTREAEQALLAAFS
jgi:L-sorbose 1-phosphate reductase